LLGELAANPPLAPTILVLGFAAIIGAVELARRNRLALAMLMLPVVWGALAATMIRFPVEPRYFAYLLPLGLVVAARGIVAGTGQRRVVVVAGLIALSAASLYLEGHFSFTILRCSINA
jgi:hypothetical protein